MPMFGCNDFDYYGHEAIQHTKNKLKKSLKKVFKSYLILLVIVMMKKEI